MASKETKHSNGKRGDTDTKQKDAAYYERTVVQPAARLIAAIKSKANATKTAAR